MFIYLDVPIVIQCVAYGIQWRHLWVGEEGGYLLLSD